MTDAEELASLEYDMRLIRKSADDSYWQDPVYRQMARQARKLQRKIEMSQNRTFDVSYVITVDDYADPVDAARSAWESMRTSTGPYLELADRETGERFSVDFEDEEPKAVKIDD